MIATTTLNRIREHRPCVSGWETLLRSLGKTEADDEPLTLLHILESNGLEDAIWALCAIDECPEIRLFAVRCVRQVQHPLTDPRSLNALDVAELYAIGEASDEELAVAESAAWDAAQKEDRDAERFAAEIAAETAAYAARDAARDAAWVAAWVAAETAVESSARDAERAAQERDFRDIFCTDDTLP